jgi:DNA-binding beta-propeller fold protein YncE
MKIVIVWLAAIVALLTPAQADNALPQFQVDPFWPKPLPNNWILGQVSGIATDRYDRIWVVHRPSTLTARERAAEQSPPEAKCCIAAPPVLVFDQAGNLIRHWGGPGAGFQWPESEHGIFVDDADFVWLAGNGKKDGQLLKFTMDGKFVLQIGKQGEGNDSNSTTASARPRTSLSTLRRRRSMPRMVTPTTASRYSIAKPALTSARGAYGKQPSDERMPRYDPASSPSPQFGNPVHCVRIDKDGFVYVCDRANNRLQVFRKDGTFVLEHIYEKMTRGSGSVFDLVFSPDKEQKFIYMVDGTNGEVRIVERASKETLGRFGRPGWQVGQFTLVHNIAVDREGNIFTSEVNTGQRVQKFRRMDLQD